MPTDEHVMKILSSGQMTWFEADKVTLSAIKARYFMDADEFLYFRKGEDWLKYLIDCLGALAGGQDQILNLANACSQGVITLTQSCMNRLLELDPKKCLDWYLRIAGGFELARKHLHVIEERIWEPFVKRVKNRNRPFVRDFKILCTNSQENIDHLPMWKARGTKVRFYSEDAEAGSHRFYLNEKGYAVFWRQGRGEGTRFYGFEGTNPDVVKQLKTIFEEEWKRAIIPKIMKL